MARKQKGEEMKSYFHEFPIKWKYDKKSESWIVYCKKYGISGYGKTRTQAMKMFKFTIEEILKRK